MLDQKGLVMSLNPVMDKAKLRWEKDLQESISQGK